MGDISDEYLDALYLWLTIALSHNCRLISLHPTLLNYHAS